VYTSARLEHFDPNESITEQDSGNVSTTQSNSETNVITGSDSSGNGQTGNTEQNTDTTQNYYLAAAKGRASNMMKSCFVACTPMKLADGSSKPIEEILGWDEHGDDCDIVLCSV